MAGVHYPPYFPHIFASGVLLVSTSKTILAFSSMVYVLAGMLPVSSKLYLKNGLKPPGWKGGKDQK